MIVTLIRHGETDGNMRRQYSGGGTDEPLSPLGEEKARQAGAFADERRVFVSPMLRARQTAAYLFPNAEAVLCDGLREMNFGDFEGHDHASLIEDARYRAWLATDCAGECPHGESLPAFSARVASAFDGIVRSEIPGNTTHLCIVAHGGTIMAILDRFADPHRDPYTVWLPGNLCGWHAFLDETMWGTSPALRDAAAMQPPYGA